MIVFACEHPDAIHNTIIALMLWQHNTFRDVLGNVRKNTEINESVTKKGYVTGDSQYTFHAGMLIQVTTPGLWPSLGLCISLSQKWWTIILPKSLTPGHKWKWIGCYGQYDKIIHLKCITTRTDYWWIVHSIRGYRLYLLLGLAISSDKKSGDEKSTNHCQHKTNLKWVFIQST